MKKLLRSMKIGLNDILNGACYVLFSFTMFYVWTAHIMGKLLTGDMCSSGFWFLTIFFIFFGVFLATFLAALKWGIYMYFRKIMFKKNNWS